MGVGAYLDQREKEITGLSAHPAQLVVAEEAGSDGQRGRLIARLWLNDEAFVEVHELVVIVAEHVHRER